MFTKSRAAQEVEERLKAFADYMRKDPQKCAVTLHGYTFIKQRKVVYTANLAGAQAALHDHKGLLKKWGEVHLQAGSTADPVLIIEALGGEVFYAE